MKHLVKGNTEISAYMREEQTECCTFNIIQHHPIIDNNDSNKDVLRKQMFDATLRSGYHSRKGKGKVKIINAPGILLTSIFSRPLMNLKSAHPMEHSG